MQGSSWPTTDDSFRTINEGTSPFAANIVRELAAAMETLQQHIGINPHDFAELIAGTSFADFAEALRKRMSFEIGEYTHLGANTTQRVTLNHNVRFASTTPLVFLAPYAAQMIPGDMSYMTDNRSSTGFDSVRRVASSTPTDDLIRYLAVNPLMCT